MFYRPRCWRERQRTYADDRRKKAYPECRRCGEPWCDSLDAGSPFYTGDGLCSRCHHDVAAGDDAGHDLESWVDNTGGE